MKGKGNIKRILFQCSHYFSERCAMVPGDSVEFCYNQILCKHCNDDKLYDLRNFKGVKGSHCIQKRKKTYSTFCCLRKDGCPKRKDSGHTFNVSRRFIDYWIVKRSHVCLGWGWPSCLSLPCSWLSTQVWIKVQVDHRNTNTGMQVSF